MHYLTIVLRLIHVGAGAFWFGSAILLGFYISPTVAATGEAGQKFMGALVKNAGITRVISAAAGLTALAGLGLYWIDSDGFTSAWTRSGPGVVFGIGGFFGLIGFIFGMQIGTNLNALVKVGSEQPRHLVRQCAHDGSVGMLVRLLVAANGHVRAWRQCVKPRRVSVAVKCAVDGAMVRHFEDSCRARQAR